MIISAMKSKREEGDTLKNSINGKHKLTFNQKLPLPNIVIREFIIFIKKKTKTFSSKGGFFNVYLLLLICFILFI